MKYAKYFGGLVIIEFLILLNYRYGLVHIPNMSGVGVLTIWASVITIVFIVFSILGLLQIDSRLKDLDGVKKDMTNLNIQMKEQLDLIKSSADDERKKISEEAKKELVKIINVSVERQNMFDKLTEIANVLAPDVRISLYTNFLQNNQNKDGINYPFIYIRRGDSYKELGRYDKAESDYKHAMELAPNEDAPYISMGCLYSDRKDYETSVQFFKKAIEIQPSNAITYMNIGNAYSALEKYKEAEEYYSIALDANPEVADTYYNRAIYYRDSHQDKSGRIREDLYKHCLNINPLHYKARTNLAALYKERNDNPAAIEEYTKVVAPLPNYDIVMAMKMRGICNRLLGKNAAALVDFNQVYYIVPDDVQNLANLSLSHLALSHFAEAGEYAKIGIQEAQKQNKHNCDSEFKGVLNTLKNMTKVRICTSPDNNSTKGQN